MLVDQIGRVKGGMRAEMRDLAVERRLFALQLRIQGPHSPPHPQRRHVAMCQRTEAVSDGPMAEVEITQHDRFVVALPLEAGRYDRPIRRHNCHQARHVASGIDDIDRRQASFGASELQYVLVQGCTVAWRRTRERGCKCLPGVRSEETKRSTKEETEDSKRLASHDGSFMG